MIVHLKLNDAVDVQIGVTKEMQKDLIECRHMIDTYETARKDCNKCSWRDIEFNDIGFCEFEYVQEKVTGRQK